MTYPQFISTLRRVGIDSSAPEAFARAVALTDETERQVCVDAFEARLREARPTSWAELIAWVAFAGPAILSALFAEPLPR